MEVLFQVSSWIQFVIVLLAKGSLESLWEGSRRGLGLRCYRVVPLIQSVYYKEPNSSCILVPSLARRPIHTVLSAQLFRHHILCFTHLSQLIPIYPLCQHKHQFVQENFFDFPGYVRILCNSTSKNQVPVTEPLIWVELLM